MHQRNAVQQGAARRNKAQQGEGRDPVQETGAARCNAVRYSRAQQGAYGSKAQQGATRRNRAGQRRGSLSLDAPSKRLIAPCCALLRLIAPYCVLLRLIAPCCALLRLIASYCAVLRLVAASPSAAQAIRRRLGPISEAPKWGRHKTARKLCVLSGVGWRGTSPGPMSGRPLGNPLGRAQ